MQSNKSGVVPKTITSLIDDFFQNGVSKVLNEDFWSDRGSSVPVNIRETDKDYELHLIAPGLKKEDFKIHLDRNLLTVSFEQKEEVKDETAGRWVRNEYRYQSFKRAFTLNDKIDTTGINARYADGILYLTLPKKEPTEQAPQEITIS